MNGTNFGFEDDLNLDIKFDDDHDNFSSIENTKNGNDLQNKESHINGINDNTKQFNNDSINNIEDNSSMINTNPQYNSTMTPDISNTNQNTNNILPNENLMVNKKKLKTNPFATKDKKIKKLEDIKIDSNHVTNPSISNNNNNYSNNINHNMHSNPHMPQITKSLDDNFNNQTVSTNNSHAKNEDIRVSNNLDK